VISEAWRDITASNRRSISLNIDFGCVHCVSNAEP
jgi:hypothetical protein